jgi:uncharacterized protein
MLRHTFSLLSVLFCLHAAAQNDSLVIKDIKSYQNELNAEYKNPATSPLDSVDRIAFRKHEFYPIDLSYRVTASFKRTPDEQKFKMKTTGSKTPEYVKYGEAEFLLAGKTNKLSIYRNIALTEKEEFKEHLFLPFTDNTNGIETYGGGRYIDLVAPAGNTIVIDFNKAYNPYCAYSDKYSCPIPPQENKLNTEIKAGIKLSGHH